MMNNSDFKWNWTSKELKKALDEWQTVSETNNGLSPDERMLADMQKLLVEIKAKIQSLEEHIDLNNEIKETDHDQIHHPHT